MADKVFCFGVKDSKITEISYEELNSSDYDFQLALNEVYNENDNARYSIHAYKNGKDVTKYTSNSDKIIDAYFVYDWGTMDIFLNMKHLEEDGENVEYRINLAHNNSGSKSSNNFLAKEYFLSLAYKEYNRAMESYQSLFLYYLCEKIYLEWFNINNLATYMRNMYKMGDLFKYTIRIKAYLRENSQLEIACKAYKTKLVPKMIECMKSFGKEELNADSFKI